MVIEGPLLLGMLVVGLLVLAILRGLWRELPPNAVGVLVGGERRELSASLVGSSMLVAVGTFGLNALLRLLVLLAQSELDRLVGSILVIENDARLREWFRRNVPAVFRDRIVYGFSEAYSGGMGNRPVDEVLQAIEIWGGPVVQAAEQAIDLHLRQNASRSPSEVLLFNSLGGQAPIGVLLVSVLRERLEESLLVGLTGLPTHERLRDRFRALKPRFDAHGLAGWVLTDNLGSDPVSSDYGMAALLLGLADAAFAADQSVQTGNAFSLALPLEAGGILVYQVVATNMVAYPFRPLPLPFVRPRYYVLRQPLIERVTKALRTAEAGRGTWSADLPVGEPGTSTFHLVLTCLAHDDLKRIEDQVVFNRGLARRLRADDEAASGDGKTEVAGRANRHTPFASFATVVNPAGPVCPVIVVQLAAVRDGARLVDEIVKVPERRGLAAGPAALRDGETAGQRDGETAGWRGDGVVTEAGESA